jgi:hypothetical protein
MAKNGANYGSSKEEYAMPLPKNIEYKMPDGSRRGVVAWDTPGDVLSFENSHDLIEDPTRSHDPMRIVTKSGNVYGFYDGIMINSKTGKAYNLRALTHETGEDQVATPDIIIGQEWKIPGTGGIMSEVKRVDMGYVSGVAGAEVHEVNHDPMELLVTQVLEYKNLMREAEQGNRVPMAVVDPVAKRIGSVASFLAKNR